MKKTVSKAFLAIVLYFTAVPCQSQSIAVGSAADYYFRFLQLTNGTGNNSALVNRPYAVPEKAEAGDSLLNRLLRTNLHFNFRKNNYIGVLPLALDQQYVSHHPLWQNDGAMIPAKGYQLQISGGLYGKMGPLQFQMSPEVVLAANPSYNHGSDFGDDQKGSFHKLYPGQSFVRVNAGPVAVSLASENLWWGPGVYHSLLMSNQAPGFVHLKLHSMKPLKTPIGNFEWTLLGGRLTSDKNLTYDNAFLKYTSSYIPAGAIPANRYLNAYVLSYMPKFMPGFSIGITRALQQYENDVKKSTEPVFRKYLPVVLKPVQKQNAEDDDLKKTDQLASAFFRWVLSKSSAEIYAEYGFNDYKRNIRDYVMNLPHAAAYLVGFRKAFTLADSRFIEAGAEIVQMRQSADWLVREAGNWYVHGGIWEGYTNQNQVMGAAFASNAQTFYIARRAGLERTALTLQRFQRDPNRAAAKWNDWVLGLGHAQFLKGFYLDGQLQFVTSQNYAWQPNAHRFQVLAKAGVRYYFHD